jgi:hypothetical protein
MSLRQSSIEILIAREKHDFLVCGGSVVDTLPISVKSIHLVTNLNGQMPSLPCYQPLSGYMCSRFDFLWLPDVLITTVYWILCNMCAEVNKSVFLSCLPCYKITNKAIGMVLFPVDFSFNNLSIFLSVFVCVTYLCICPDNSSRLFTTYY